MPILSYLYILNILWGAIGHYGLNFALIYIIYCILCIMYYFLDHKIQKIEKTKIQKNFLINYDYNF